MRTEKRKTPKPSKVIGAFQNQQAANGKAKRKFCGTENPMNLLAIAALMRRSISRQEMDTLAGRADGPALAAAGFDVSGLQTAGGAQ